MSKPTPVTVAIRHPGIWPMAFGPYRTGGIIHHVDPTTAERLFARGFERVSETTTNPDGEALAPAVPTPLTEV